MVGYCTDTGNTVVRVKEYRQASEFWFCTGAHQIAKTARKGGFRIISKPGFKLV
jgi:hypothetical protein